MRRPARGGHLRHRLAGQRTRVRRGPGARRRAASGRGRVPRRHRQPRGGARAPRPRLLPRLLPLPARLGAGRHGEDDPLPRLVELPARPAHGRLVLQPGGDDRHLALRADPPGGAAGHAHPPPADRLARARHLHPQEPGRAGLGPLRRALRPAELRRDDAPGRDRGAARRLPRDRPRSPRRPARRPSCRRDRDGHRRRQPRPGSVLRVHRPQRARDRADGDGRHAHIPRAGRHGQSRRRRADGRLAADRPPRRRAHLGGRAARHDPPVHRASLPGHACLRGLPDRIVRPPRQEGDGRARRDA